jgi:hypothetical protein
MNEVNMSNHRRDKSTKVDERLTFSSTPEITIATNTFKNVPIILQYEDTPLIEIVKTQLSLFTTQIPIYDLNGTYLAKVVGARIFPTESGKSAGLSLRFPKNMTVCEQNGKTLFELLYRNPASLSASAELYTPDGAFIKTQFNSALELFSPKNKEAIQINGITLQGCVFENLRIGIQVYKQGNVAIGVS